MVQTAWVGLCDHLGMGGRWGIGGGNEAAGCETVPSMTFRLTKHHGLGNDFLVHLTDDPAAAADRAAWSDRARLWCHRSRGIGADGLIIGLWGQPGADLVMTLVNADGSLAEMSGNGIRCLAQAEAARRGLSTGALTVSTDGGLRTVTLLGSGPAASDPEDESLWFSVEMGPAGPGPDPDGAGRTEGGGPVGIGADGVDAIKVATFDLGNPHIVILVSDPQRIDVEAAGRRIESGFAGGINVHFVAPTVEEPDAIDLVVWERGAGVTEACGTGATAAARAVHDWGLTGPRVTVHMPGGDVTVQVGDPMVLEGPSTHVADVEVLR